MTPREFIIKYHTPYVTNIEAMLDDLNSTIAAAVQAEREVNCAAVCPLCAGQYPDYLPAVKTADGLWEHPMREGTRWNNIKCDAAAIRARSNNGAG